MSSDIEGTNDQPEKTAAKEYLASLLNKQLFIHATDERIFAGEFKCTDNVNMSPMERSPSFQCSIVTILFTCSCHIISLLLLSF